MEINKGSVAARLGGACALGGLVMALIPLLHYVFWATSVLYGFVQVDCGMDCPATVGEFISAHAGTFTTGIIALVGGFILVGKGIKLNVKFHEERNELINRLQLYSTGGLNIIKVGTFSKRDLVYHINKALFKTASHGQDQFPTCVACGLSISDQQNEKYHAICAKCHFIKKGTIQYARGILFMIAASSSLVISLMFMSAPALVVAAGICILGLVLVGHGHYLVHEKPKI